MIINNADADAEFVLIIVTGTGVLCDPKICPSSQNGKLNITKEGQTLQSISDAGSFYYYKSLCHFEFVLSGQTMNQTFNIEILRRLQDVIRRNALENGQKQLDFAP